jgi:hypothetical protein
MANVPFDGLPSGIAIALNHLSAVPGNPIVPGNPVIPGNPTFGEIGPAAPIIHALFAETTTVDVLGVAALTHDTLIG